MASTSRPASITSISFNCPHCGALAHQSWYRLYLRAFDKDGHPNILDPSVLEKIEKDNLLDAATKAKWKEYFTKIINGDVFMEPLSESKYSDRELENVWISQCYSCSALSLWIHDRLIHPPQRYGEEPNPDLPADIRVDYEEARAVLNLSPRAAAALLRLCIQKLCKSVGERGKNINDDIASLVAKGLDTRIQQALDIVRVIGNEAVHPGELDLRDDRDTAIRLFQLVNLIAERMITQPKEVKELYEALPASKREQISERDANTKRDA
jgi:hypothetical protein